MAPKLRNRNITRAEAEAADAARNASSSSNAVTSAPDVSDVSRVVSDATGRNLSVREMIITPGSFKCPITQDVMEDPVVAADGHSYEKSAFWRHLDHHHEEIRRRMEWTGWARSPMTNVELADYNTIPNRSLKSAIAEWRQQFRAFRAENPDLEEVAPGTQLETPAFPTAYPTPAEARRVRVADAGSRAVRADFLATLQAARARRSALRVQEEELIGLISALNLEGVHHRVRDQAGGRVRDRAGDPHRVEESLRPINAVVLFPPSTLPQTAPPLGLQPGVYTAQFPPPGGGSGPPPPPSRR